LVAFPYPLMDIECIFLYGFAMIGICTAILYLVGEFTKEDYDYIMESINPEELSSSDSQISKSPRPRKMWKYIKNELSGNDSDQKD